MSAETSRQNLRSGLAAGLILLALILAFLFPAWLPGQALLPTDLAFELDPLWRPLAPAGFTDPGNRLLSDQTYQFYPWRAYAHAALRQGRIPLWNPAINGGQPFLANGQTALFSPFSLIGFLFPLAASFVVMAGLRLFVAGIFTYLLARSLGIRWLGSILAMIVFPFSLPMLGWLGYAIGNTIVWLPALLYYSHRWLLRGRLPDLLAALLVTGFHLLGGHPESSFHIGLVWLAFWIYETATLPSRVQKDGERRAKPTWGRWAAGGLAIWLGGMGLAAVQLAPFAHFLLGSEIVSSRAGVAGVSLSRILTTWQDWPALVTALLPRFWGIGQDGSYWYPYSNSLEQTLYLGVIPLLLALTALIDRWRHRHHYPERGNRRGIFWAVVGLASVGLALELPLFNGINLLPGLNLVANSRLRLVYGLAVALLAGMGLDRLMDLQPDPDSDGLGPSRILTRLASAGTVLILAANGAAALGLRLLRERILHMGRTQAAASMAQSNPLFWQPLAFYFERVELLYAKMIGLFAPSALLAWWPAGIALGLWLFVPAATKRRVWLGPLLVVLTAADLFLFGAGLNPATPVDQIFPTPAAVTQVQAAAGSTPFRVVGQGLALMPNSAMLYSLDDIRGYDAMTPARYADILRRIPGNVRLSHYILFADIGSPLLDLLNVEVAFVHGDLHAAGTDKWQSIGTAPGDITIYRNPNALPRAFIVHRAEFVPDAAASLARVMAGDLDFRQVVVVEGDAGLGVGDLGLGNGSVTWEMNEPERVVLTASTGTPGYLVLTDGYDPGWRARVDGAPTPILIANHAFRAIHLPAGTHEVIFEYRPPAYFLGATLSLTALGLWLLALIWAKIYAKPRIDPPQKAE
ncbi:MAG: YfhO family protein [Caldilineaceae bacterium]|nr:YfhO family protein [Caldilineaceae bacterium]MBP8109816.1 YfhO family protein [Caldilineaceae bacterium]MBP8124741.1 YfhO family protein [Caldilineaceae bacterium]MBP9073964.1 YfhO family protein [Caldilineaceae bacterium]